MHNLNGRVRCAHGVMALDAVTMLIWIEGEVFFHVTVAERREIDVAADGAGPRFSKKTVGVRVVDVAVATHPLELFACFQARFLIGDGVPGGASGSLVATQVHEIVSEAPA